ncbi:MAG: hypothetical protein H6806_12340 [Planctomycetes bacterium]|nr:hypothetical protein [Planctomycetota bacterium]
MGFTSTANMLWRSGGRWAGVPGSAEASLGHGRGLAAGHLHDSIRKRAAGRPYGFLVFWAAGALVDQEKWDEVIKLLDGYHGTYGAWRTAKKDSNDFTFYSGTMAYMVEAYLGKNDIENAIDWFHVCCVAPESLLRLPIITQRLASYYNDQAKGIEDRLRTLLAEGAKLKGEFGTTEKTYYLKAGGNAG